MESQGPVGAEARGVSGREPARAGTRADRRQRRRLCPRSSKTDAAARDLARVAAATGALTRRFDELERELDNRDHLCGDFGVADIATFMVVSFASTLGVAPGPQQPRLAAWVERVRARPTVGSEFGAMTAAAALV
jgi:glutathione S-transferase